METSTAKNSFDYQEFNKFQTYFYTNVQQFNNFTNFEIKRNSVMLLLNISKGFPKLAQDILNIYSPEVKAIESPNIIRALQQAKFVNGFSKPRVPQYIYFKSNKAKPVKKSIKRTTKKGIEFTDDIISEIQSILRLDSKSYDDLKYSDTVQNLGKQILGEIQKDLLSKKSSSKK